MVVHPRASPRPSRKPGTCRVRSSSSAGASGAPARCPAGTGDYVLDNPDWRVSGSEGDGTRTRNHRIDSPVL